MKDKTKLIMKQLHLFEGWLSRAESIVTYRGDIALSCDDMRDFGLQQARAEVYRETLDVFALVMKNVDEILIKDNGGEDGERN